LRYSDLSHKIGVKEKHMEDQIITEDYFYTDEDGFLRSIDGDFVQLGFVRWSQAFMDEIKDKLVIPKRHGSQPEAMILYEPEHEKPYRVAFMFKTFDDYANSNCEDHQR
jgi:hypothetical protein